MILHYIKLAIRGFWTKPLVFLGSFIAIALGTLSISFLLTYVQNELTTDRFYGNNICALTMRTSSEATWNGEELMESPDLDQYPEIEAITCLRKFPEGTISVMHQGVKYTPEVLVADSSFLKVFDYELIRGNMGSLVFEPYSMLLTESYARKYFGKTDVIGQTFEIADIKRNDFVVKGIIKDPPSNSSIEFDVVLIHKPRMAMLAGDAMFSKMGVSFMSLSGEVVMTDLNAKIQGLAPRYRSGQTEMKLIPLEDIYFEKYYSGKFMDIFSRSGDKEDVRLLIIIMGLILVVSILNFSNLLRIGAISSLRNVGISRINGANHSEIVMLKVTELGMLLIITLIFVTGLYYLLLPYFDRLVQMELTSGVGRAFLTHFLIMCCIALIPFFPSLVLSLRTPTMSGIKDKVRMGGGLMSARWGIVTQFSFTIFFLIISLVVFKQWNLMLHKDLGWKSENVIRTKIFPNIFYDDVTPEYVETLISNMQYVLNELNACPYIESFNYGNNPLQVTKADWKPEGSTKEYPDLSGIYVKSGFDTMWGVTLIEGRFFDPQQEMTRERRVVINEAAKRFWEIDNISDYPQILGIVKDYHFERLTKTPRPLIIRLSGYDEEDALVNDYYIRFAEGATRPGLEFVRKLHDKVNNQGAFEYRFMSDELADLYQKEKQFGAICGVFSFVILLITCTGVFAMSLRDARQRTKEIGIRKVNGARISQVLWLLNKDFLTWVGLAFVIATPIAWYAMTRWLESFAYKTPLSWWVFALAGVLALTIALLTVSWQSWKAATRNPVESLRYE